jgi:hypothetical protein
VAERVAGLGEEEAAAWIEGHGLFAMAGCDALPAGVRARLRERSVHLAAYNLYAVERFQAIADALAEGIEAAEGAASAEIPVCPLKGIYLLDTIYRSDPGSRGIADLDLLVPAGRMDDAVARLEARLGLAERPVSRRLRRVYPERVLAGKRFEVELHDRLGYKHGAASAWSDLAPRPARVHDREVHALDRETTLVHLVSHLVKHRPLSRLGWVEDVLRWAELGVDGERATAVAERLGARRSLVAGVRVIRRVVGDDLLPGVPDGSDDRAVRRHERRLWSDLAGGRLPDPPGGGRAPSKSGAVLSTVLLADRPAHAVRAVAVKAAEVALRGRRGGGAE